MHIFKILKIFKNIYNFLNIDNSVIAIQDRLKRRKCIVSIVDSKMFLRIKMYIEDQFF